MGCLCVVYFKEGLEEDIIGTFLLEEVDALVGDLLDEVEAMHLEDEEGVHVDLLADFEDDGGDMFARHRTVGTGAAHGEVVPAFGEDLKGGFIGYRESIGG